MYDASMIIRKVGDTTVKTDVICFPICNKAILDFDGTQIVGAPSPALLYFDYIVDLCRWR